MYVCIHVPLVRYSLRIVSDLDYVCVCMCIVDKMGNGIDRLLISSSFLSLSFFYLFLFFIARSFSFTLFSLFFLLFYNDDHIYTNGRKKKKQKTLKKNPTPKVKHQSSCKLSVICLSTFYIYMKDSKEKKTNDDRKQNQ
jgi:hypothetical protein